MEKGSELSRTVQSSHHGSFLAKAIYGCEDRDVALVGWLGDDLTERLTCFAVLDMDTVDTTDTTAFATQAEYARMIYVPIGEAEWEATVRGAVEGLYSAGQARAQ
jgi:hypothetical protein